MSVASATPSKLKSPAYVAITVTVCAAGSSSQPSVRPLADAVVLRNWPASHRPPSQLAVSRPAIVAAGSAPPA